jgi:ribosomal protein S6--L-glutamate ligase
MIASLHPCIRKDINILCAGRSLTDREKKRLGKAQAVILPQGVTAEVYRECRRLVPRVFPNYDLRFGLEGKVGDALLFEYFQVPHPRTLAFRDREAFSNLFPDPDLATAVLSGYPLVLKGNEGGEGSLVFLIKSLRDLKDKLRLLLDSSFRRQGFVLQEFIDHGGRDLRVVILYDQVVAYWRVQPNPSQFRTNQLQGGEIDPDGNLRQKDKAAKAVEWFCHRAGIQVAGFDILFDRRADPGTPLFLEINYYFGRRGLGGSLRFYELFEQAADRWLAAAEQEEKQEFSTKIEPGTTRHSLTVNNQQLIINY